MTAWPMADVFTVVMLLIFESWSASNVRSPAGPTTSWSATT